MKVWITKYALTEGVFSCEVEPCFDISPKMVKDNGGHGGYCYHKPHWHERREEALARAETMRTKKLASLQKQIKAMKALKFS